MIKEPSPVDDFGKIRRESADRGRRTRLKKLEEFGDAKPYGGMTKEQLRLLPPEIRKKYVEKERLRRKYRADKRSKSWIMPRQHLRYEVLYIPYRKVLEEQ